MQASSTVSFLALATLAFGVGPSGCNRPADAPSGAAARGPEATPSASGEPAPEVAPQVVASATNSAVANGTNASATPSAAASAVPSAVAASPVTLRGRLYAKPAEGQRRSVDSYLGRHLRLELAGGGEQVLQASEEVSEAALAKAHGKQVELQCIPQAPSVPNPMEQSPMGPDGKAMERPAACRVTQLTVR